MGLVISLCLKPSVTLQACGVKPILLHLSAHPHLKILHLMYVQGPFFIDVYIPRFHPWVGKISWRRKWQPHSSTLAWKISWTEEPGRLQYSTWGSKELDTTWRLHSLTQVWSLRKSSGVGNGNLLQYSCLENPMDRGTWRATIHRGHQESDTTEQLSTHNI